MKYLLTLIPIVALTACAEQRVINGDDLADGTYQTRSGESVTVTDGIYYDQYGALVDVNPAELTGIQGQSDRIVLSDYSQEQQKRDREEYARRLDEIEAARITIDDAPVAEINTNVNVIAYARSTSNQLGQSKFQRSSGKRGNCRSYGSADSAQRAFLSNGGPAADELGLDPDGDGFACDFDPSFYRSLRY